MDSKQSKDEPIFNQQVLDLIVTHGRLQSEIVELMKTVDGASLDDLKAVNSRLEDALQALRTEPLESLSLLPKNSLQNRIANFANRIGFEVSESGVVSLVLDGGSYIEFLEEAQLLSQELSGGNAICPETLEGWMNDERFIETPNADSRLVSLNPLMVETGSKDRFEQEEILAAKGMKMLTLPELAVIHAANFVIKGEDIFRGYILRTEESALALSVDGLDDFDPGDWARDEDIIASSKNI